MIRFSRNSHETRRATSALTARTFAAILPSLRAKRGNPYLLAAAGRWIAASLVFLAMTVLLAAPAHAYNKPANFDTTVKGGVLSSAPWSAPQSTR